MEYGGIPIRVRGRVGGGELKKPPCMIRFPFPDWISCSQTKSLLIGPDPPLLENQGLLGFVPIHGLLGCHCWSDWRYQVLAFQCWKWKWKFSGCVSGKKVLGQNNYKKINDTLDQILAVSWFLFIWGNMAILVNLVHHVNMVILANLVTLFCHIHLMNMQILTIW